MKKAVFITFMIISISSFLSAMPPHPDAEGLENREHRNMTDIPGIILKSASSDSAMRTSPFAVKSEMKVLVLLVDFEDTPGYSEEDPLLIQTENSLYKNILESGTDVPGGLTMKQYYLDMSDNNLELTFDIKGPYHAPRGWQYYGENDSAGYDRHAAELVGIAVDQAEADGVDFSLYNNNPSGENSDNMVDTVIIIHAGRGEETGASDDTIWSHNWTLSSAEYFGDGDGSRTYDGVTINNYTIQPEYTKYPDDSSIGVFCHEFGHVLGLPDLYDTSGSTVGVGKWSLMSGGSWGSFGDGKDPAPLLAWERDDIGGSSWISINELSLSSDNIQIDNIEVSKSAYRINLDDENYLILEGKTDTGSWYVPDKGILITQVNSDILASYRFSNFVNAGNNRVHGVNIIEAVSPYYDNAGRGGLWKSHLNKSDYGSMCFSLSTKNELLPSSTNSSSAVPAFFIGKNILILLAAALIFIYINSLFRSRLKPLLLFAFVLPLIFSISSCPGGGSGETIYPLVDHPNTNYYMSEDIYSKVGNSGVRIYDISSNTFPMNFDVEIP